MSDDHAKSPHGLKSTLREYLTHWTVAGLIVTLTGFTPDHWIAHALHEVPGSVRNAFPEGIDYRLLIVLAGVAMIVADAVLRNWRRRKAAPAVQGSAATVDGTHSTATHASGAATQLALQASGTAASHRRSRRSHAGADATPADDSAAPVLPAARVAATQLRHDLRTPMNAILGYGEMLVAEAEELGIGHLKAQLQALHEASKSLLEGINEAVPASAEESEANPDKLRRTVREKLDAPAQALLQQAKTVFDQAAGIEAAHADLDRLVIAAGKLVALIGGLSSPAASDAQSGAASVEQTLGRLSRASAHAATAQGRLLIVDDNAMNRDVLSRQLVREGYDVMAAASGKEALEQLRLQEYDLVLLDVVMPQMDGLQTLAAIQGDPALADVPVVMLSALDEIAGVARCLEQGACDYLTKPVDPTLLRARVKSTLQIRYLRQDLRHTEQTLQSSLQAARRFAGSIVPASLAPQFDRGESPSPMHYPEVTVVVARLEGIDALAARLPADAVSAVGRAFAAFERCSGEQGCTLTRMTDRSFTAVWGAPDWQERHAARAVELAIALRASIAQDPLAAAGAMQVKLGVHTGGLMTGMAGADRLVFGLWGDAVSLAEAIAASAAAGSIQLSMATCAQLDGHYPLETPVILDVPGRGRVPTRRIGLC